LNSDIVLKYDCDFTCLLSLNSDIIPKYDCDFTCLHFDMFQADVDGNGSIDYVEFITATMHRHKLEKDEHLFKAFQYFDKDSSG
jgi:hypothetical protein